MIHPAIDIDFNLSHSGDLAVMAVSTSHTVGVDIEKERPIADPLRIAHRTFPLHWIDRLDGLNKQALNSE
jgi:4'-phosphopantetheinyl transferase